MGKIKLLPRERWLDELESTFMQYVEKEGKPGSSTRKVLMSELYEYIDALEYETGDLDGVLCMDTVITSERIKVVSAYGKDITARVFKTRSPRKNQQSGNKWEDQEKAMVLVSSDLGKKLTRKDLLEWIFNTFNEVGIKLSKEILGEFYFEDFYNKFAQSHKSFDDFLDYSLELQACHTYYATKSLNNILFKPSITRIARDIDNENENSFDFIDVTIPILSNVDRKEANKIISSNLKEVVMECLKTLNSSSNYTKFGVPTNCLKIGKAVITNESTFVITFELKDYDKCLEKTSLF